ncbi:MAG: hypothetical protein DWQ01_20005 [Planctomycetota bacterium]|nr:MAG: hypothetical protein DWQ01_20005 [Planctomycetota bacterium]
MIRPALGLAALSMLLHPACADAPPLFGEREPAQEGLESRSMLRNHGPSKVQLEASTRAKKEKPEEADWRSARGTILRTFAYRALEQGLIEEARHYLTEACEMDPQDGASHAALARLYLTENDVRAALAYATRAAENNPDDQEVALVLAAALSEADRTEEATLVLEKIWQVNPGDPEFAQALLTHYAASGSHEMARRFVERLLAEQPESAYGWRLAGDAFLAQGRLDEAVEAYKQARERDSSIQIPYGLTADLEEANEDMDPVVASAEQAEMADNPIAAERLYRFLLRSNPEEPAVHLGLARVLLAQDRSEEARYQLAQVPLGIRGWREHLLQAKIDIQVGNWASARSGLMLAINDRPGLRSAELLLHYVNARLEEQRALEAEQRAQAEAQAEEVADQEGTP